MKRKTPELGIVSINVQCECGRLHKLREAVGSGWIVIPVSDIDLRLRYYCPESKKRKEIML